MSTQPERSEMRALMADAKLSLVLADRQAEAEGADAVRAALSHVFPWLATARDEAYHHDRRRGNTP